MLVVQVSYQMDGGGLIPLATSHNRALAREVARRIIAEMKSFQVGDRTTRELARLAGDHLEKSLEVIERNQPRAPQADAIEEQR